MQLWSRGCRGAHSKVFGAMFNEEGSCDDKTEKRIGTAARMVGALRHEVTEHKELSIDTK